MPFVPHHPRWHAEKSLCIPGTVPEPGWEIVTTVRVCGCPHLCISKCPALRLNVFPREIPIENRNQNYELKEKYLFEFFFQWTAFLAILVYFLGGWSIAEMCLFPTDIIFLWIMHEVAHILGHLAYNIKPTRGNVGWGGERSSGYHPTWGSITQRSPGNTRWCVRVSQRRVASLLWIDCHPCIPLILEDEWARSSLLHADQLLLVNHGTAELKTGQKVKRTSEPALQLVAAGDELLCWFQRPGNRRPEVFRLPPPSGGQLQGPGCQPWREGFSSHYHTYLLHSSACWLKSGLYRKTAP